MVDPKTLTEANDAPAIELPPAVPVPIDASGSGTAVLIRGFLFQLVIAAGVLIGVLGLGEGSQLVKWIRFFQREEAIPVLTAIAAVLASGWQLLRGLRKHRALQTLSFFFSNRIAKSPASPVPAVAAAVEAATVVIDRQGASPAPPVANLGV